MKATCIPLKRSEALDRAFTRAVRERDTEMADYKWDQLISITSRYDEHDDDFDGACFCRQCMSYVDRADATWESLMPGRFRRAAR